MSQGKILAIDDEQNIRHLIRNEFMLEGFDVTTAKSGEEGLGFVDGQDYDVVLLDLKLPKMSGIETLKLLKRKNPRSEVIMITGYGDIHSAVESVKLGARDYVTKPFKLDELLTLVKYAVKDSHRQGNFLPSIDSADTVDKGKFLVCPSKAMQEVYALVKKIAPTENTILIQGETGSGKDVLAAYIHRNSPRKSGPFLTLDCGLLTPNLVESELYGHKKGSFSGASEAKVGLVEKSHGGTLFLDEIGNIDLDLQKKFLRFLETGRIRRVGETKETQVDTRVVLATNLSIEEAVEQGRIRSDLFYRMAEFSITIPPLRKRPEDILPLTRHFLSIRANDSPTKRISPEAAEILISYPWPGNIRELKSAVNKVDILADSEIITKDHLPTHFAMQKSVPSPSSKTLEDIEKEHIMRVLAETDGNQSQAANVLGINRKTLYKKIKKYKIFS
ncbi:MAG: sigma-54 dependent transcriptional regulator [Desulfobacterales bacterium]|jgi:DNA-binding NtrC family response regulator